MSIERPIAALMPDAAWIGELPTGWFIAQLRRLLHVKSGDFISADSFVAEGFPVYGGNGFRGYSTASNTKPGTVLIGRYGALCGNVHQVDESVWATEHAFRVFKRKDFVDRFIFYLLQATNLNQYSARAAQPGLNSTIVEERCVPVPPLQDQASIAEYLDHDTRKIDELISKQQSLLLTLNARREAMTASIFQSASQSSFVRLKFLCDILPGYAFPSEQFGQSEGGIRLLRGINIAPGRIDWSDFVSLPTSALTEFKRFSLNPDDIVVGMDRPWIGSGLRVALIRNDDTPSLLVQRVARLRCHANLAPKYAEICLRSPQFLAHFEPDMTGVSVPHISDRQIGDFRLPVPTKSEQESIIERLSIHFSKLASLAGCIRNSIEALRERRTALITAAVTGALKIPPDTLVEGAA